jgi:hypothetical protein
MFIIYQHTHKLVYIDIKITLTCFGVNTPPSDSLQLCQLKLWIITMIKYNIVMCYYAQYEHKSSHFCGTQSHLV